MHHRGLQRALTDALANQRVFRSLQRAVQVRERYRLPEILVQKLQRIARLKPRPRVQHLHLGLSCGTHPAGNGQGDAAVNVAHA